MSFKLSEKCYELLQKVPKGKVTTYKILANKLGTSSYRAIGQIMKRNPRPIEWPCHRVVMSSGDIGGYLFGQDKKIALLKEEGVLVDACKIVDIKSKIFLF